ncbi:hypothetical protein Tco_0767131 [Tanacetum coccineum]
MNEDYYEQNSCYDPNSFGFDQYQPPQFPVNYPPQETNREILQAQEDLMEAIQAFLKEYDHIPPNEKCMTLLLAEERFLKIKQTMREEHNQPEVIQELLLKLMDDLQSLKGSQQEKKETTTQSLIPYCNSSMIDDEEARDNFLKDVCTFLRKFSPLESSAFLFDDYNDEYIVILVGKKALKQSHPRTISKRAQRPSNHKEKRTYTILNKDKSSVENLDPIPSGSKGVSNNICDNDHSDAESLLSQDIPITSPKINFLSEEFTSEFTPIPPGMDKDEFDEEEDDCYNTTSDDDSYENIEYVEASSLNLEYDSLEEENEDHEEKEFDLEDIFQIQDMSESLPISLIPVEDSDPVQEEIDIFLIPDDLITLGVENNDSEDEDNELPNLDHQGNPSSPRPSPEPADVCLNFKPDTAMNDKDFNQGEIVLPLNVEDVNSFTFVIWTFLPFFTYPEDSHVILFLRSEDLIFDPGISTFHFSLEPVPFALPKDE